jgi:uncharacterized DUF497 family protein
MEFRWNGWNIGHVQEHGVLPRDAMLVVEGSRESDWVYRGDGKWLVRGRGRGGGLLQVVFMLDADGTVFVTHARLLTDKEKKRLRRTGR